MTTLTIPQLFKSYIDAHHYPLFARITGDMKPEAILEAMRTESEYYQKVIISSETGVRNVNDHFHVMSITPEADKKNLKQNFRNLLKRNFPEIQGNKSYSITETKTESTKTLAAYVVKDGNFIYYGFTPEEIKIFSTISYKKFSAANVQAELNRILEKYYCDPTRTIDEFARDYVTFKKDYNQNLSISRMKDYLNLVYAKKEGVDLFTRQLCHAFHDQKIDPPDNFHRLY